MIVQPRRAFLAAEPGTIKLLSADSGELFIECEVTSPLSAAGRTAYIRVTAEQVPALLKAARSVAISARRQPMSNEGAHHG